MYLSYYLNDEVHQVYVTEPCPGCDLVENLAIFTKTISYANDRIEYHVGCNKCGWMGPHAPNPVKAAQLWDSRK